MAVHATLIPARCAATLDRKRGSELKIGCDRVVSLIRAQARKG